MRKTRSQTYGPSSKILEEILIEMFVLILLLNLIIYLTKFNDFTIYIALVEFGRNPLGLFWFFLKAVSG